MAPRGNPKERTIVTSPIILLVSGALGYMAATGAIAHFAEPDAWTAAVFGIIPFAVGLGYFVDWTLIRRDARASS
jgi:hypothetical protein